ncbi:diguanylate cyclase (GGDEF)-like protein [Oxalobacteraceae bacterium GrIS 1.11]
MKKTPPASPGVAFSQERLGPYLLGGMILLACLGLTYGVWRSADSDAQRQVQADFDFRVRELVNNIASRMQTYIQVLYGVQGLFGSSELIDRRTFHHYVAMQQIDLHFPGIHGIGYMRLVAGGERAAHVAMVRAEGFPDYDIAPAGERAAYAPVVYLEPFGGSNVRAFGFDPYSEASRRTTLERARDSGLPMMTAKIRLVQEQGRPVKQAGFLIVLPVYHNGLPHDTPAQRRAAILGWVYAPFRMGDLMAGLGGGQAAPLDLEIYDGEVIDDAARMVGGATGAVQNLRRHSVQQISLAGHRWTLLIGAPPSFDRADADKPRLIAAAGLLLSLGLAALTCLLARSRSLAQAALRRAGLLTSQLNAGQAALLAVAEAAERSEAVLRSILDSTIDGILVDNLDGKVLNSNRRFRQLWTVPDTLAWQADGVFGHLERQLLQAVPGLRERAPTPDQSVLHLKDGRVFEQACRSLQLGNETARLWSFRDISERSQSEQRERTRRQVLELLTTGAALEHVLESVVLGVEAANPSMLCSILLLDDGGRSLLVGAAPSLPAFFNAAVHGMALDGAHGHAVRGGARVIVENIAEDPLWQPCRDLAARAGLAACWSEPVRVGSGKVLGSFAIYHRWPSRPSAVHIALIEESSQLAGIAIEQARAGVALRAGEARFRSLYDHAPVALWEQDWSAVRAALGELVQSGVDDLVAYLRANPSELKRLAGLVRIVDVNAAALAQVGAAGPPGGGKSIAALSLAQNFAAGAMDSFAGALTALARGDHFFACESSFLRLDGVARQNELTLLVMPGHEHSLDFVIVSTLDITERKRMNDELLLLATTDSLTSLPNRRQFMARLDAEHARLRRDSNACAAVLMLDLDHFKAVNDGHGHAIGDAMLRHVADLMAGALRKVDTVGRIGGEEFAILLPGTDLAAACVFAERLRRSIADTPLSVDGGAIAITLSIGIAAMSAGEGAYEGALMRADQALYRAKRGGRNRVEHGAPQN